MQAYTKKMEAKLKFYKMPEQYPNRPMDAEPNLEKAELQCQHLVHQQGPITVRSRNVV
jgi:hypothetical protein